MTKARLTIAILLIFVALVFAKTDTAIPLSNNDGVPFFKDEVDFYVDGFEIDSQDCYYFFGGDKKGILAKFTAEKKCIYRRSLENITSNGLQLHDGKLLVFDNKYGVNTLSILDADSGKVIHQYPHVLKNPINAYTYCDPFIVLQVFNYEKRTSMATKEAFVKLSRSGQLLEQTTNPYGLPDSLYPKEYSDNTVYVLGHWADTLFYQAYDFDKRTYKFWLENTSRKILATATVPDSIFGESFYGNPEEHWKYRNNNLYVLSRKGTNALITRMTMKELFPIVHKAMPK